jgi:hypothetical protein
MVSEPTEWFNIFPIDPTGSLYDVFPIAPLLRLFVDA